MISLQFQAPAFYSTQHALFNNEGILAWPEPRRRLLIYAVPLVGPADCARNPTLGNTFTNTCAYLCLATVWADSLQLTWPIGQTLQINLGFCVYLFA